MKYIQYIQICKCANICIFCIHEHMFEFYVYIFNISDVKFGNYQIIEAYIVLEK